MKSAATAVLVATMLAGAGGVHAQTVGCDGLESTGTGATSCAAMDPRLYAWPVANPNGTLSDLYIGTDDPNPANYTLVCMPAGWTMAIEGDPFPIDHNGDKTAHGVVGGPPMAGSGIVIHFSGPAGNVGAAFKFGFNHPGRSHDVGWVAVDGGGNTVADWTKAVGGGEGPVHGPLDDAPPIVYVYNSKGNDYNYVTEGVIWSDLGLLQASGKPGVIQANGDIETDGGVKLGEAIKDGGGNVIGLRNLNGDKEAYNLSGGATADRAWQRVTAGGEFRVNVHGPRDNNAGVTGGGLFLDNAGVHDGFKDKFAGGGGTGVGWGAAYGITPRANAGITMALNACYSKNDPDGAGADLAVTVAAAAIPGVGATSGYAGQIRPTFALAINDDDEETFAAAWALANAAKKAKFRLPAPQQNTGDYNKWFAHLPFEKQFSTAQGLVGNAVNGATITVTYMAAPPGLAPPPGGGPPSVPFDEHTHPTRVDSSGGEVRYEIGSSLGVLEIPAALLSQPELFHANILAELPGPEPAGTELASTTYDFRDRNGLSMLPGDATLTLGYFDVADTSQLDVYRFDEGVEDWVLVGCGRTVDEEAQTISVCTSAVGPVAAFAPAIVTCAEDCGDGDGNVGTADLLALLSQWGGAGSCDLDGGGVGTTDLLALLASWGACPGGP